MVVGKPRNFPQWGLEARRVGQGRHKRRIEDMQSISVALDKDLTEIKIDSLADLHLGDKHCDRDSIRERIKAIADDPTAYVILNGDLINNATKTSVSDVYEGFTPEQEVKYAVNLLEPIKDRIISITEGNHEWRTYKKEGIDITWMIATMLGCHNRYMKHGGVVFLDVGTDSRRQSEERQVHYSLYHTHGSGGGKRPGGKANRLEDMLKVVDADIYIHSHTHAPMVIPFRTFRTDLNHRSVYPVDKLAINTGAPLDYGGYGQQFEYSPSSKKNPILLLSGTTKEFKAIV